MDLNLGPQRPNASSKAAAGRGLGGFNNKVCKLVTNQLEICFQQNVILGGFLLTLCHGYTNQEEHI